MNQKTGSAIGTIEYSPARLRRLEQARKRQEARWAAKAGPVTVRWVQ